MASWSKKALIPPLGVSAVPSPQNCGPRREGGCLRASWKLSLDRSPRALLPQPSVGQTPHHAGPDSRGDTAGRLGKVDALADASHWHHGQRDGESMALSTSLPSFTAREVAASRGAGMNLGKRGERRLLQGQRETG